VAAGTLMIQEAGGLVKSPSEGASVLEDGHFLAAANDPLFGQLKGLVAEAGL